MIATYNAASVGARRPLRGDVVHGIDFETITPRRQIARRMQRRHIKAVTIAHAFQQAAAFIRICGARGGAQRVRQRRLYINAERQRAP